MKKSKSTRSKLVMNLFETQYELLQDIASEQNFKVTIDPEDN